MSTTNAPLSIACLILSCASVASAPTALGQAAAELEETLQTNVKWAPGPVNLQNFVGALTQRHEINIMIDSREVSETITVDPDGIEGIPLSEALAKLLEPAGLAFSVQDDFLWISTPERLRHEVFADLETRVYELRQRAIPDVNRELAVTPRPEIYIDELANRLVPVIVDGFGDPLSFLTYVEESGQLIVHNTPQNLDRLEKLLELIQM